MLTFNIFPEYLTKNYEILRKVSPKDSQEIAISNILLVNLVYSHLVKASHLIFKVFFAAHLSNIIYFQNSILLLLAIIGDCNFL